MNKLAYAAIIVVMLLVGAVIAYVVSTWQGTVTWTLESKQFSVWDSSTGGTQLPTSWQHDLGTILSGQQEPLNFYLENNGNIEITIQATGQAVGATPLWNSEGLWTVPMGTNRVLATLTLTITGTGNYDWDFTIA